MRGRRYPARRELLGGMLILLFGAGTIVEGWQLKIGSLRQMGAGYFPLLLGVVLVGLGLILVLAALIRRAEQSEAGAGSHPLDLRGSGAIVAGVLAFVGLGQYFGLMPATFATVFISALGDRSTKPATAFVLAAVITLFAVLFFNYFLQIPFAMLKW